MSTVDRFAEVRSLGAHLAKTKARDRQQNATYARRKLDRLMDELNEYGVCAELETLLKEMRSDGFLDAAFHAIQALPLLKQAETHLERAKGKLS